MRTLWKVILHKPVAQSDAALLNAFVSSKSDAAFTALVERHGGMVLGVCQRILGHTHDAEDAFQATFIVLAQKAGKLHGNTSLGPWLYGVAQRVALKARSRRGIVLGLETEPVSSIDSEDLNMHGEELRPIIDEEIARLPEHYRSVFVLCELQGMTKADAARQLGCPEGTVSSRLMRAREQLRGRLTQRGVSAASLAFLSAVLVPGAVSAQLVQTTAGLASQVALGVTLSSHVTSSVLPLTQGAAPLMVLSKLQMTFVGIALAAGLSLGTGYVAGGFGQEKESGKPAVAKANVKPRDTSAAKPPEAKNDAAVKSVVDTEAASAILRHHEPQLGDVLVGTDMSLDDWLQTIEKRTGLASIIDQGAFREIFSNFDMKEFREQLLTLPRMTNQSTGTILHALLDGVVIQKQPLAATFLIRRGTLVIVPKDYVANAANKLIVSLDFKNEQLTLADALEELAQDTGISIIQDARIRDKARDTIVSTSFRNIKLINAVRLLVNMADLSVISVDGALYVSTPDICEKLEADMARGGQ